MTALLQPPILFAHRGARALAPDNTIESFQLACKLGATGLETDAWATSDGKAVLHHDGVIGRFGRRKPIAALARADLPSHIPLFSDLAHIAGDALHVSVDCKDATVSELIIQDALDVGFPLEHLWLCTDSLELLGRIRENNDVVRLVNSERLHKIKEGPERRVADLDAIGVNALNMHCSDWNPGLATLVHRFGLFAFAWDAQQPRTIMAALTIGADAIYSDHVDRMVDALAYFQR